MIHAENYVSLPWSLQKSSASEKRGARSSFKLSMSRRLPFLKKKDTSQTGSDEPKGTEPHRGELMDQKLCGVHS